VNLVVLLVPVAGLEFARIYERQLLAGLERDMRDQAALVRELVEAGLADGEPLEAPRIGRVLTDAAVSTRTRIRVLDARGEVRLDSHVDGPPEGPEPPAPTLLPESVYDVTSGRGRGSPDIVERWSIRSIPRGTWPQVADRREVRSALAGHPDAYTRIRDRAPAVFLFVTEPIRHQGAVGGVVYVTRSTQPVLTELYRIRRGLIRVLVVAVVFTLALTLILAWSISRPLSRLAKAANRIARGERVKVPVAGTGEIRELGEAFRTMTDRLDARLAYIRDFAADVAHELKSPLTSIRGAAELLGEGAVDDDAEARARFLKNIELDAERLDRLVTRLLELSRLDASQAPMDSFDVAALVRRVVERTHTPEQPVRVEWQAPVRSWRGRAEDLERALLNLVENALRFSPEGQPVHVVVSQRARDELRLEVRDHGPGVPEALRRKIFERFFTTDADRNGTGLGLAIVRSVAEAHAGRVELDTREDGGAVFTLVIGGALGGR
jgi:two-component system sensor histidine kinase ChvG